MTLPLRISTTSAAMLGTEMTACSTVTVGVVAWPTTNRAFFVPLKMPQRQTTTTIWWWNGATLTNNADAGIFDINGNRIASTGSTARSGSSLRQAVSMSISLDTGLYYLGLSCAGTTGTFQRATPNNIATARAYGILMADNQFPLGASIAYTALDASFFAPIVGLDFA